MGKTTLFKINGQPFIVPDENVSFSYEDLDSEDSGRDEVGVMHRFPIRYKVLTCSFSFSTISEEDKNYMESLFPDTGDFEFTCPKRKDSTEIQTIRAYRSKYSVSWKNAKTGMWNNYGFNVIEC